jgi:anti-sigma factor RsiW
MWPRNRHLRVRELTDLAGGEVSGKRQERMQAHLEQCPRCREEHRCYVHIYDCLAHWPLATIPPDEDLRIQAIFERKLAEEEQHQVSEKTGGRWWSALGRLLCRVMDRQRKLLFSGPFRGPETTIHMGQGP